ncbi:MAG: tyrosine-protein phosphatase [Eubacteriales bacterium]|nr:tyrosine-protein phosphatase [Eubacteriales bacterium]
MKPVTLEHTHNTRSLGGYAAAGGRTTQDAFLRSDAPVGLTAKDVQTLRAWGVTDILDLRSEVERAQRPTKLEKAGFACHAWALAGGGRIPVCPAEVPPSYLEMTQGEEAMRQVFGCLARAKGTTLFHCTAGKDRTGVVAALLLLLVGVAREAVVRDYAASHACLAGVMRQVLAQHPELDPEVITPRAEHMNAFLDLFLAQEGSAAQYLTRIGVPADEIVLIKDKLVGR